MFVRGRNTFERLDFCKGCVVKFSRCEKEGDRIGEKRREGEEWCRVEKEEVSCISCKEEGEKKLKGKNKRE